MQVTVLGCPPPRVNAPTHLTIGERIKTAFANSGLFGERIAACITPMFVATYEQQQTTIIVRVEHITERHHPVDQLSGVANEVAAAFHAYYPEAVVSTVFYFTDPSIACLFRRAAVSEPKRITDD